MAPYQMSQLRKQLQNAKADYESAKYPGDLAADVFARQATRSASFWRQTAPYIAAAACVAVIVGWAFYRPSGETNIAVSVPPAIQTNATSDSELAALPAPEAIPESSTLPSDLPLVPSMSVESIPSPPSMASMDLSYDQPSF